jgi:hypothetical protein
MSDFGTYKSLKAAELTSSNQGNLANTAVAVIDQVSTRIASYGLTAQANANANVAETLLAVWDFSAGFIGGNITTTSNLAANVASYATLTVLARTQGGASRVVALANLSNVALTAFVPYPLTVPNMSNAQLAPGDTLSYTITASAAPGVAIPTGALLDVSYKDL